VERLNEQVMQLMSDYSCSLRTLVAATAFRRPRVTEPLRYC